MAYVPVGWEDRPSRNSPVNSKNLKHVEDGIIAAHTKGDELQAEIDAIVTGGTESDPRVSQALVNASGHTFDTLKARLDDNDTEVSKKATYYDLDTQTGTALHFTNAEDAVVKAAKIEGATYQLVTSQGKNLLPMCNAVGYSTTINGVTFTINSDGSIKVTGTATATTDFKITNGFTLNGTYTLSGGTATIGIVLRDATSIYDTTNSSKTITPVNVTIAQCHLRAASGQTYNVTVYPQLEVGSSATTYTPFVPNSPSVDYPAPITNAKNFDVVACGKNRCPQLSQTTTQGGITFTKNNDGSITMNGTSTSEKNIALGTLIGDGITQYTLSGNIGGGNSTVLLRLFRIRDNVEYKDVGSGITCTPDATQHLIWLTVRAGVALSNITFYPKLEIGTTATAYEPYKSNQVTIPYEMADRDTIEVGADGKTRFMQRKVKFVFDGSIDELWTLRGDNANGFSIGLTSNAKTGAGTGICTNYKFDARTSGFVTLPSGYFGFTSTTLQINDNRFTTVDTFKASLALNPITVQYELATPIETIIPDIYLTSYPGVTNIFNTANPQVTLTASAKSQLWWERKLIDGKFDKANIIQTDAIGGMDKVASAEVTKALGLEIDALSISLSNIKMVSIVVNPDGLDYVDYQVSSTLDSTKGVIAMNGDIIAAHEINIIGISIVGSNTIRIYFNATRSGAVRINLLYTLL